jgi:cell division septum initiation protein DivIVA
MSDLSEIVDSLEKRITKVLQNYEDLKNQNEQLENEITSLRSQQDRFTKEINQWQTTCDSLKYANSMLGSDEYKRDTKLKINALVREIDRCITQLSE